VIPITPSTKARYAYETSYDSETGEVAFRVSGVFRDTGGKDEFTWNVNFTVLALG
jgi:hypothetical protein